MDASMVYYYVLNEGQREELNAEFKPPGTKGRLWPAKMKVLVFSRVFHDSALSFSAGDTFSYLMRTNGKAACFLFELPSTPRKHKYLNFPNNVGTLPAEHASTFYPSAFKLEREPSPPFLHKYPDDVLETLRTDKLLVSADPNTENVLFAVAKEEDVVRMQVRLLPHSNVLGLLFVGSLSSLMRFDVGMAKPFAWMHGQRRVFPLRQFFLFRYFSHDVFSSFSFFFNFFLPPSDPPSPKYVTWRMTTSERYVKVFRNVKYMRKKWREKRIGGTSIAALEEELRELPPFTSDVRAYWSRMMARHRIVDQLIVLYGKMKW
ncbi:MAG TPA: hypothetical protein VI874_04240, partial [Candidatus Norongarragalinales archaeon]|nr:hypothetical protein [Candidatus Norongarragalinales archaeon]